MTAYNIPDYITGTVELQQDDTVIVLRDGVMSSFADAIEITGSGTQVTNLGVIASMSKTDSAIRMDSGTQGGLNLLNDGLITSQAETLHLAGTETNVITNLGEINTMRSFGAAIMVETSDIRLYNHGLIQAPNTALMVTDGIDVQVRNSGQINASTAFNIDANYFRLINTGEIVGDVQAGNARTTLINRDLLDGRFYGGDGADFIDTRHGFISGTIETGAGKDSVFGSDEGDEVISGAGDDLLFGNAGDDTLNGGSGDDRLFGGDGTDQLLGSTGDDRLYAGEGDDILTGGDGRDILAGGGGSDVFVFQSAAQSGLTGTTADIITDFTRGEDVIDLDGLSTGDLLFRGTQGFAGGGEGSVRYTVNAAGHAVVMVDADGDGQVDMRLIVRDTDMFDSGDFVL